MVTVSSPPPPGVPPLAALLSALLRHRRALIGFPLLGLIVGSSLVVFNRRYTADGFFTPQSSQKNAGASSLGALLGLPSNMVGPESVEFYRTLINSRDLLSATAQTTYRFAKKRGGTDSLSGTLLDLYRVPAAPALDRVSLAAGTLRRNIGIGMDRQAMIVDVQVTTPWPELSEQVAARLLELLNQFDIQRRHARAAAAQRLIEDRLDSAGRDVLTAEEGRKRFLERNRKWQDDPKLSVEMQRVTRKSEEAQQVYQSLRKTYEEARIEEARDVPTVTVLQSPIGTARAVPPVSQGAGLGLVIGTLWVLSMILVGEYVARERALHPAAYADLERLVGRPKRETIKSER